MIAVDINILIAVYREEDPRHVAVRAWFSRIREAGEQIGLMPAVVSGYVRIVTSRRIFADPTPIDDALAQIDLLRSDDATIDVSPGPRHWEIFARLCREVGAQGDLVADAAHAATAIEHGATWVSLDRDFARFPELKWQLPDLGD